jgi:hypothetical protein
MWRSRRGRKGLCRCRSSRGPEGVGGWRGKQDHSERYILDRDAWSIETCAANDLENDAEDEQEVWSGG